MSRLQREKSRLPNPSSILFPNSTVLLLHQNHGKHRREWQSVARGFVRIPRMRQSSKANLTTSSMEEAKPLVRLPSLYKPLATYNLEKEKHYQQQFADMYFLRLTKLKSFVEAVASQAWEGFEIGGEEVSQVERVLDVRQGQLCWVAGTVYMDMPLKPNILEDISKDVSQSLGRGQDDLSDYCIALERCPTTKGQVSVGRWR